MKNYWNCHGLTLSELLITTTIIGVIMMGMVSVDYSLRKSEQQQTRTALVALRTSAIISDILNTARQGLGDPTQPCIQISPGIAATDINNYICINRDLNTPDNNKTPDILTDDTWTCYTRRGTNLHKCNRTAAAGFGNCPAAANTIIGTVPIDTFSTPPVYVSTSPDLYLEITINNRYDPTVPYATVLLQEYMTNPKISLTSRVSTRSCGINIL